MALPLRSCGAEDHDRVAPAVEPTALVAERSDSCSQRDGLRDSRHVRRAWRPAAAAEPVGEGGRRLPSPRSGGKPLGRRNATRTTPSSRVMSRSCTHSPRPSWQGRQGLREASTERPMDASLGTRIPHTPGRGPRRTSHRPSCRPSSEWSKPPSTGKVLRKNECLQGLTLSCSEPARCSMLQGPWRPLGSCSA